MAHGIARTKREQRLWEKLQRRIDNLGRLTWTQKKLYWRLKDLKPYRPKTTRQEEIRDAAEPRIGESEEQAKERVKSYFKPDPLDQYDEMDDDEREYYELLGSEGFDSIIVTPIDVKPTRP